MLRLHLQSKAEIEYGKKVQKLYKTPGFSLVSKIYPCKIDQTPLKNLVDVPQLIAPILTSLVINVDLLTRFSHFTH